MLLEHADQVEVTLLRLQVEAEADPAALPRILGFLQVLNVVPRRVLAERGVRNKLHVQVDVLGLSEPMLSLVAAKIEQVPYVFAARWYRA